MSKSTCVSCIKKKGGDKTHEAIMRNTTKNKIKGKHAPASLEKKKASFILRLQHRANEISGPYLNDKSGIYKLLLIELQAQGRRLKKSKITAERLYCIFIVLHKKLTKIYSSELIFSAGLKILQNNYYYFIGRDMFSKKLTIFLEDYKYNLEKMLSKDTHYLLEYYSKHKIQQFTLISTCLALIMVVNHM